MKDYLIKFEKDGRRGTTYADGVHYYVNPDGTVENGSIDVTGMLKEGYIFVETEDYARLLGNGEDHKEYCLKDGEFVPFIQPEPTAEEKAIAEKAALKSEYETNKKEMLEALQSATLAGNTEAVSSIQNDYKEMTDAYKEAVEGVDA